MPRFWSCGALSTGNPDQLRQVFAEGQSFGSSCYPRPAMVRAQHITSAKNPLFKRFKDAALGKLDGLLVAEGVRLAAEVLDAEIEVEEAAVAPRLESTTAGRALQERLERSGAALSFVPNNVFERLSSLTTHQGVALLAKKPRHALHELTGDSLAPLVVLAAGVRDPGNLGALIRTSEAAGADGLIALAGGADPFREKAVRGSMGSVFRLPVVGGIPVEQAVTFAKEKRLQLVVADGGGTLDYSGAKFDLPTLLVLGGETGSFPREIVAAADVSVQIPLCEPVDSLNVAVASGILLFEARRQRQ